MNKSSRLLELDVLRGIAALGVVLYHYTSRYNRLYGHSQILIYFPYGKHGIELFLIISGFVIFMTLEKTKSSLQFLFQRFSRLYPAYWVAVILTFTIVSIARLPDRQVTFGDALINLTMFQDFFKVSNVDGVYWTLKLELSFYIIMFAIHKAKLLNYIDTISIGWLIFMVSNIVLEKYGNIELPSNIKTFFLLEYANLFILGINLYKIYTKKISAKNMYIIIPTCALVYQLAHTWEETMLLIGFTLVFYLVIKKHLSFIICQPLLFLGTISYTLYLIHQNIGYVVIRSLYSYDINPNLSIVIALVLALVLATIITFTIEKPMLRFLKLQYQKKVLKILF